MKKKLFFIAVQIIFLLGIVCITPNNVYAASLSDVAFTNLSTSESSPTEFSDASSVKIRWKAVSSSSISGASYFNIVVKNMSNNTVYKKYDYLSLNNTEISISSSSLNTGDVYKVWMGLYKSDGSSAMYNSSYSYQSTGYFCVMKNEKMELEDFGFTNMASSQSNAETCTYEQNQSVKVKWNSVTTDDIPDASYFQLSVADITTPEKILTEELSLSNSYYVISSSELKAGHTYKVWLGGFDSDGNSLMYSSSKSYQSTGYFYIEGNTMELSDVSFLNLAENESGAVTKVFSTNMTTIVKWKEITNDKLPSASYLKLSLFDCTDMKKMIDNSVMLLSRTEYEIPSNYLISGNVYKVWLGVYDANDNIIKYSQDYAFQCEGYFSIKSSIELSEVAFTNLSTSESTPTSFENGTVSVSWKEVNKTKYPNASYLRITVYDKNSATYLYNKEKIQLSSTSLTIPASKLTSGHNYNVWLGVYNDEDRMVKYDVEHAYQANGYFSVKSKAIVQAPGKFSITGFDASKIKAGSSYTINWTESENADYYRYALTNKTTGTVSITSTRVDGRTVTIPGSKFISGNKYELYVVAYDADGNAGTAYRNIISFQVTNATDKPGAFSLIGFDASTIKAGLNYKISWTESQNAAYYRYALANKTTGILSIPSTKVDGREATISGSKLINGNKYELYVVAYDVTGNASTAYRNVKAFQVTNATDKPGAFSLVGFDASTIKAGLDYKISWTESQNAAYYRYALANKTTGILSIPSTKVDGREATISGSKLIYGNKYELYVVAYDATGNATTAYRNVKAFQLTNSAGNPGAFNLIEFDESNIKAGQDLKLSWTVSQNASYYRVAIADKTSGTMTMESVRVDGNEKTIVGSKLQFGNTYELYVVAYDATGNASTAYRNTISFRVSSSVNYNDFCINFSAGRKVSVMTTQYPNWTVSKGATKYRYALYCYVNSKTTKAVIPSTEVSDNKCQIPAGYLTSGKRYILFVSAYNGDTKLASNKVEFETVGTNLVPSDFTYYSDFVASKYSSGDKIKVTFGKSTYATYYRYCLRNLTQGVNVVQSTVKTLPGSVIYPGSKFEAGNRYALYLVAYNETGNKYAKEINITIPTNSKCSSFNIINPTTKELVRVGSKLNIQWTASANASFYKLVIMDGQGSNAILSIPKVTSGQIYVFDTSKLIPNHKYDIYVAAYNSKGESYKRVERVTFTTAGYVDCCGKLGGAHMGETGNVQNNVPGDQNGEEVSIGNYYNGPWSCVVRAKDPVIAEKIATMCEAICRNDKVGYDWGVADTWYDRKTLDIELKKVNYDVSKLNVLCECDCSSLVATCVRSVGINVDLFGTGKEVECLKNTNMFTIVYISNFSNYSELKRGDILWKAGHTEIAL